jgi:hypothetical protein
MQITQAKIGSGVACPSRKPTVRVAAMHAGSGSRQVKGFSPRHSCDSCDKKGCGRAPLRHWIEQRADAID